MAKLLKSSPTDLRKLLWVVMVELAMNSFGVVLYSVVDPY